MSYTNYIGIAAGILTGLSLLPQLIKVIKEKQTQSISTVYLLTLLSGLCLWIYYGFLREDVPLIVTNGVSVIFNIAILILGSVYKRRKT
jgi:MtN3 and saliva related transmembrane protein